MTPERRDPPAGQVVLALLAVYIFWGSTAPAIHVAVQTVPPFAMASVRFLISGAALWAYLRIRSVPLPSRSDCFGAFVTGSLLLAIGNGSFSWSMRELPGGLGSLFFALSPLWMVLAAWPMYGERPRKRSLFGVAIALTGILVVISPASGVHLPALPTAIAIGSSMVWSLGSLLERRFKKSDVVQASAIQLLVAGAELGICSWVSGEHLSVAEWTPLSLAALAYLIVFGSIVGYSAYIWLSRHVRTTIASTYAYVNPIVAVSIGVVFLHEPITTTALLGAAIVLAGVSLMMSAPPLRERRAVEVA
jgi:drug/metabolite transporter (DMT)-like permease